VNAARLAGPSVSSDTKPSKDSANEGEHGGADDSRCEGVQIFIHALVLE
jgi:hypothetical protein